MRGKSVCEAGACVHQPRTGYRGAHCGPLTSLSLSLILPPLSSGIKALPWYTSVREKLVDPAYAAWFVPFNCSAADPLAGCHVPVCDTNYDPPLCSALYHDQTQTGVDDRCRNAETATMLSCHHDTQ